MHDILNFLKLTFDAQELVSFHGVLPLAKEDFHLRELENLVSRELLVKDTSWLELVTELHNKLIEKGECGSFIVFVICDSCSGDIVQSDVTVAFSDIVLKRDGGLASLLDAASDRA